MLNTFCSTLSFVTRVLVGPKLGFKLHCVLPGLSWPELGDDKLSQILQAAADKPLQRNTALFDNGTLKTCVMPKSKVIH